MPRYNVYQGKFYCHTCKAEVPSARSYYEEKEITWLCKSGHMSRVSLQTKKSKKDYERKIRE